MNFPDLRADRSRQWAYLLILGFAAAWVIFPQLGGSDLNNDEAIYAQVVEHIRETHNWLQLYLYGQPYFNKPPLYFWLTALTMDGFADTETAVRFWSALLGWGTVLLTGWLGGRLFHPEAGLLAGSLLLANRALLVDHGVRDGCLDTGLTFFALVAVSAYVSSGRRQRWGWAVIGLAAAAACLFKPLVGLPLLALLGGHFMLTEQDLGWRQRLLLPCWGLIVMTVVASPWYLLQVHYYGEAYLAQALGNQVVKRATTGLFDSHVRGPFYYPLAILASSKLFVLCWPAVAFCLWQACRSPRSWTAGLIVWMVIGWLAMCTASSSKLLRYAYPVFPLICLAIAHLVDSILTMGWRLVANWRQSTPRWHPELVVSGSLGLIVLALAIQDGQRVQSAPRSYLPWRTYCRLLPALEQDQLRFISYRYQASVHTEGYYAQRMPRVQRLDDAAELGRLLRQGPALVLANDPAAVQELEVQSAAMDCRQRQHVALGLPSYLIWTWPAAWKPRLDLLNGPD